MGTEEAARRRTSMPALAALALGIVALACLQAAWPVAAVLGAAAIVVSMGTRADFRADDALRGAGVAGVGCVLGAVAVALALWPLVFQTIAGALG